MVRITILNCSSYAFLRYDSPYSISLVPVQRTYWRQQVHDCTRLQKKKYFIQDFILVASIILWDLNRRCTAQFRSVTQCHQSSHRNRCDRRDYRWIFTLNNISLPSRRTMRESFTHHRNALMRKDKCLQRIKNCLLPATLSHPSSLSISFLRDRRASHPLFFLLWQTQSLLYILYSSHHAFHQHHHLVGVDARSCQQRPSHRRHLSRGYRHYELLPR